MQLTSLAYDKLPFSPLFTDYVRQSGPATGFYPFSPFESASYRERSAYIDEKYRFDRSILTGWLAEFNRAFDAQQETFRNIERLEDESALAIITGQQTSLFGGPLYTIYKTLTAIHLSEYWEQELDRPVIPVFWLADEDHDYEEVRGVTLPREQTLFNLTYERPVDIPQAASKIELKSDFEAIRSHLQQELGETDFSSSLGDLIEKCYRPNATLGRAFGRLLLSIFGEYGLVLSGSHDAQIKQHLVEPLKRSVQHVESIHDALREQSRKLSDSYHEQVTIFPSNLFLHSGERGRIKIKRDDPQHWSTEAGHRWSRPELVSDIEQQPERFSPNVFLRPILQDWVFPTLTYVGGPGEVGYYGQMKSMYHEFDMQMPIIAPRLSATVVESKISRIYQKLPFTISDYQKRIEDLETAYARQAESIDIEAVFEKWKQQVQQISDEKADQIKQVDPTLEKAVGKATAVYFNELDKLKGKVHRATKSQEETQLKRIRKIKNQLFPNNELQERNIAFVFFMNKYGMDLWDRLKSQLDFDASYRKHQVIYL